MAHGPKRNPLVAAYAERAASIAAQEWLFDRGTGCRRWRRSLRHLPERITSAAGQAQGCRIACWLSPRRAPFRSQVERISDTMRASVSMTSSHSAEEAAPAPAFRTRAASRTPLSTKSVSAIMFATGMST